MIFTSVGIFHRGAGTSSRGVPEITVFLEPLASCGHSNLRKISDCLNMWDLFDYDRKLIITGLSPVLYPSGPPDRVMTKYQLDAKRHHHTSGLGRRSLTHNTSFLKIRKLPPERQRMTQLLCNTILCDAIHKTIAHTGRPGNRCGTVTDLEIRTMASQHRYLTTCSDEILFTSEMI